MLDKKYDHIKVEKGKYASWLKHNYFKAGDLTKEAFSIVIPPPNVTGKLHLGHAWDTTLQDIIIRYKKMDGYDTLWLPGMDHAAIATEVKVVDRLKKDVRVSYPKPGSGRKSMQKPLEASGLNLVLHLITQGSVLLLMMD